MDADAERTLKNLHVISAIAHNDKLLTNGDDFNIYSPTSLRGLFRAWYGEGRTQNVARIRQQIQNGIKFATKSLDDATALLERRDENMQMRLRVESIVSQHMRMMRALEAASTGLTNLSQTYRDDAALTSQLALAVSEVQDFVATLKPLSVTLRPQKHLAVCDESVDTSEN